MSAIDVSVPSAARRLAAGLTLLLTAATAASAQQWPSFRGPQASGVAAGAAPVATSWNVPDGTAVLWKTPIPGLAVSSPIVSGDRIFVSTAVSSDPNASLKHGLYGDVEPAKDRQPARLAPHRARSQDAARCCGTRWRTRACRRPSGIPSRARRRRRRPPTARTWSCRSARKGSTPIRLRRQAALEAGPRRAQRRLVLRSRLRVGRRQLADHLEEPGDRAVRHPAELVRRGVRRQDRQAGVADAAATRFRPGRRRRSSRWTGMTELVTQGTNAIRGYDPTTGKELWRLSGQLRDHHADADRRPGLRHRHQRLPRRAADLRASSPAPAATSRSPAKPPARRRSPGAPNAAARTCRRRSSTATCSTSC